MRTLYLFTNKDSKIPASMIRVLEKISRCAGREDLYKNQMPELIDRLVSNALIESITSSCEMEGIKVARPRADVIIGGHSKQLRTRSEKELAGYRDAANYSFANESELLSTGFLCHLHRLLYGYTNARGGFLKTSDNIVIEYDPFANEKLTRFKPVSAAETPQLLCGTIDTYNELEKLQQWSPIILIGAFILDFLIIHPFADGNGRVARIATNHLALRNDLNVVRYVSIEKLIQEQSKEYYAALLASTKRWDENKHDPWPWIEFLANTFLLAYEKFEEFASNENSGKTKQERVREYVLHHENKEFSAKEISFALPSVSDHAVRLVLKHLQEEGLIKACSTGRNAKWVKK